MSLISPSSKIDAYQHQNFSLCMKIFPLSGHVLMLLHVICCTHVVKKIRGFFFMTTLVGGIIWPCLSLSSKFHIISSNRWFVQRHYVNSWLLLKSIHLLLLQCAKHNSKPCNNNNNKKKFVRKKSWSQHASSPPVTGMTANTTWTLCFCCQRKRRQYCFHLLQRLCLSAR